MVYKGYLNTAMGKELVAVKTGKGIISCMLYIYTEMYDFVYLQHYSPVVIWSDLLKKCLPCYYLNTLMSCLWWECALTRKYPY